jgi:hypothetical protein
MQLIQPGHCFAIEVEQHVAVLQPRSIRRPTGGYLDDEDGVRARATTRPELSTSGPPELPGFSGASV